MTVTAPGIASVFCPVNYTNGDDFLRWNANNGIFFPATDFSKPDLEGVRPA
jgi:hypothetical protein